MHKAFLTFESVDQIPKYDHSKESKRGYHPLLEKAIDKFFPVVLFIMLCKAFATFVDQILKYGNSNESSLQLYSSYAAVFFFQYFFHTKIW